MIDYEKLKQALESLIDAQIKYWTELRGECDE